jgi:hypothetical protein
MPRESRAPAVAELARGRDPFDSAVIGPRQPATSVAEKTQLDLTLKVGACNHQGATPAAGRVATGWIPALAVRTQHANEPAPGGAPLGPASRKLDMLTGKRPGHEHHAILRLDDRVAAAADRPNPTFDGALPLHQRSPGSMLIG